jgi:hypothetical protein
MLDVFKFCFKHEQCNIHWWTLYCYSLYPYFMHFIVHWMNFLHGCLICVMIVSRALYVSDLFQYLLEHLLDDWHILYPWSVNLFCIVLHCIDSMFKTSMRRIQNIVNIQHTDNNNYIKFKVLKTIIKIKLKI